jgi:two-component system, OmpR family, osmolarity sensor histidine kinase EnvZ
MGTCDSRHFIARAEEESIRVSREVELLHSAPPADAYVPNWTHLRWRALQEALLARDMPVNNLVVSGSTGESIVWLNTGDALTPRWVGVRSNMEGADFPARWAIAMALSLLLIGIASWWLSRKIVKPLQQLEKAVRAFSKGQVFVSPTQDATSEIRTLIHAFERMALEREDLDTQRALMLAGISHDIRSPLARIRVAAELLPNHHEVAVLSERIVRNVDIADGLIESFSDYVRAESEPMNQKINIAELATAIAKATEVEYAISPKCEAVWVWGSKHLLQRALSNLIDNAKSHGRPPILLDVNVGSATSKEIHVSVCDHGEGIAEQDRERLIRPFERGDTARGTPGSGLGLAITARVAKRHGGSLKIKSLAEGGVVCVLVFHKLDT